MNDEIDETNEDEDEEEEEEEAGATEDEEEELENPLRPFGSALVSRAENLREMPEASLKLAWRRKPTSAQPSLSSSAPLLALVLGAGRCWRTTAMVWACAGPCSRAGTASWCPSSATEAAGAPSATACGATVSATSTNVHASSRRTVRGVAALSQSVKLRSSGAPACATGARAAHSAAHSAKASRGRVIGVGSCCSCWGEGLECSLEEEM